MTVSVRGALGVALAVAAVWSGGTSAQDLLERRSEDFAKGIRELHEKASKDVADAAGFLERRSGAFADAIRELHREVARRAAEQPADPGAANAEDDADMEPEDDREAEAEAIDRILPRGAVVFFQRPDCPPPFVMLAEGRGRLVLGSGSGGPPATPSGQGQAEPPSIELIACVRK